MKDLAISSTTAPFLQQCDGLLVLTEKYSLIMQRRPRAEGRVAADTAGCLSKIYSSLLKQGPDFFRCRNVAE